MLARRIIVVVLLLCLSSAAWATTFVAANQITPTASVQRSDWAADDWAPVANLINSKGFDDATLTAAANSGDGYGYLERADYGLNLWNPDGSWGGLQYSPSGLNSWAWVAFSFNTPQAVDKMWVWNYNNPGNLGRDWKTVAIDYTTNGTTWTRLGGNDYWFTFAQSPGADGYVCNNKIDFGGLNVKGVCLTMAASGNYFGTSGAQDYYCGLSEVRFEVPEPITMVLLGLGGLIIGRKRK